MKRAKAGRTELNFYPTLLVSSGQANWAADDHHDQSSRLDLNPITNVDRAHPTTVARKQMASIMRPEMLRQSALSLASKRLATTSAAGIHFSRPSIRPSLSKLQQARPASVMGRIAPFHSSAQRQILPPGPQVIEGGVNDPAPVPKPSPTHGSYHWTAERLISLGLVPLTVAPFVAGSLNPTMDALLAATIIIHSHIGFQYARSQILDGITGMLTSFTDPASSIISLRGKSRL